MSLRLAMQKGQCKISYIQGIASWNSQMPFTADYVSVSDRIGEWPEFL